MKKLTLFLFVLFTGTAISQHAFIRQNGTSTVYYSITDAFNAALDNDTIYLPGGPFSIGTLTIDKKISVFGAGHHPDSTLATYATTLTGNIVLLNTASFGSIEGIYLTGTIQFGTSPTDETVTNYNISRCCLESIVMGSNYYGVGTATYINVKDNIIRNLIRGCNAQFVNVENNLIQGALEYFDGNVLVKNNDFIRGNGCPIYNLNELTNVTFENNIFMNAGCYWGPQTIAGVSSCIFQYNVFNQSYTFPYNTNIGAGNIVGVSNVGFFLNEGNLSFEYADNYHLTSPALYIGNDGNQVGMYGGFAPYKEGGVPKNPHIITKTIAPQTTPAGDLNISISVGAQGN